MKFLRVDLFKTNDVCDSPLTFFYLYNIDLPKRTYKFKMINKSVLTLLIILPILASTVSVSDNQPWDITAFATIYKLDNLYSGETVSVLFQYGTIVTPDSFTFNLKSEDGITVKSTATCTTNPCAVSFLATTAAGNYKL